MRGMSVYTWAFVDLGAQQEEGGVHHMLMGFPISVELFHVNFPLS